ncbi:lysozyme [Maribacter dokdonensis]|uniref:Lysozyme n=1 Tax=Maribacter dokdonensis TaxID=320912 RepID=A0ABY0V0J7_9FLAO|nr:lysozyme [Maribacter dokdonensis]SDT47483.1 lysozyme [Maribacter dokdonensis]
MQRLSENGNELLKELEGFRSEPYLDTAGVPTIGYGNTYYLDGTRVTMDDPPLHEYDAKMLKAVIMPRYEKAVREGVKVPINQNQFDALVCFTYNVGPSAFLGSTLLKVINQNPNNFRAINAQFKRWNKSGGKVDKGLINRRLKEIALYGKN